MYGVPEGSGRPSLRYAFLAPWDSVLCIDDLCMQRDIPFSIKIPEDVPPSIALENGGGIKYELIASISYKAKK